MSGPFKLKYNKSSFPFKSPLKDPREVRMTDPPQKHYHETDDKGKDVVKWRTISSKNIDPKDVIQKGPAKPLPPDVDPKSFLQPL